MQFSRLAENRMNARNRKSRMKHRPFFIHLCAAASILASQDIRAQASAPASSAEAICKPEYPEQALKAQVQGVSVLVFHVDERGKVTGGEVLRSSGRSREHRMLDKAALYALMLCPFERRLDANGQARAYDVEVPYTWRLQ